MPEVKTREEILSEMRTKLEKMSDRDLARYADCILPGWHRLVGEGTFECRVPRLDEDIR